MASVSGSQPTGLGSYPHMAEGAEFSLVDCAPPLGPHETLVDDI